MRNLNENFYNWFGDSKVVDSRGNPLIMFHGTDESFTEFSNEKIGSNYNLDKIGFFFTSNKDSANRSRKSYPDKPSYRFTDEDKEKAFSGNIMEVYLKVENPLDLNSVDGLEWIGGLSAINQFDNNRDVIISALANSNSDGVILKSEGSTFVMVIDPTQIKSVDNIGTFDPYSKNIMEAFDYILANKFGNYKPLFEGSSRNPQLQFLSDIRKWLNSNYDLSKEPEDSDGYKLYDIMSDELADFNQSSIPSKRLIKYAMDLGIEVPFEVSHKHVLAPAMEYKRYALKWIENNKELFTSEIDKDGNNIYKELDKEIRSVKSGSPVSGNLIRIMKEIAIETPEVSYVPILDDNNFNDDGLVDISKELEENTTISKHRYSIPKFRGITQKKILKHLKETSSLRSPKTMKIEVDKFNTPDELASHLYYHGSGTSSRGLKAGATLPKDAFRSGGYDEMQHSISLSKNKNMASNFTGDSRSGIVYPVLLKKDSKVINLEDKISDAMELEEYLVQLWENDVDAVYIGGGEEELVVLNPRAIVQGEGESFSVFGKKHFKNEDVIEFAKKYGKDFSKTITEGVIFESESLSGKEFLSVDIQPEYQDYFSFRLSEYIKFLNENYEEFSNITFFYNGEDTLGMVSQHDYIMWLIENGLDEDVIDEINFYDKGYNFFRYAMDEGIDHDEVVHLIAFMAKHDINDSREVDEKMWDSYLETFPSDTEIVELLKDSDDMIYIPDMIDELDGMSNSNLLVVGGGQDECLAEVLIALKFLNKEYKTLNRFVY